ncbi:peptidoglycan-binding protein LysM [Flavobacterium salilacus subsp. salilacus]|uniref:peptidoglycan-binding protein LysM n=1 Tax=Flavobacterium TaxID=237 RepID=UPI001074D8EB|nr:MULTISPECIES: peptidoglycan-binding protein LysM [Flavobacterium]KAF2519475.1 peptidoglycan-binding protein LysM [Flavobacterium salilacus subsp. salilacus]MBE1614628.1 peptidoglycan-binding protein LysM [Flavobacterium sp. SaA2.13]NDI98305.1 peptidoglycan-binding protein LysM [Flavobacterium salilacus subsp. altitudinum]
MIKKQWMYFLGLALIISIVSSGFKPNKAKQFGKIEGFHLAEDEILNYTVAAVNESAKISVPFTGKSYIGFKQAIAIKESQGLYKLVNPYGYMGKYQFGKVTLRAIGITDTQEFLNNPQLQERAFKALLAKNKWELRKEIPKYEGKVINGIKITESGLLAAAHLAGAGSVKKFLKSNGTRGFKDGFGTSLKSYIKKFGGYDTSNIVANRSAKVKLD